MKQSMYYAVYDISDDIIRTRTIQILKDAGFTRIQKSVFCGKISGQQKKDVIENVKNIIPRDEDSFYLLLACTKCFGRITIVGKGFDKEYVSNDKSSIVL